VVWTTTSSLRFENASQKSKVSLTEARFAEMTIGSSSTLCFKFWRDWENKFGSRSKGGKDPILAETHTHLTYRNKNIFITNALFGN
jgi:hypothetical protein